MNTRFVSPDLPQSESMQVPIIYVKDGPVWEYMRLIRRLSQANIPDENELNTLGTSGWELAAIFADTPFMYLDFRRLAGEGIGSVALG
ncbi:MAG: hypothetical protein M5U01_42620 [Ardenticatenaceae bacterium]|nr:hypothetical protein [Ardenticatenaceae bacterium]HBY93251.1 hypothetical protein [Chloroflexota bacterium]